MRKRGSGEIGLRIGHLSTQRTTPDFSRELAKSNRSKIDGKSRQWGNGILLADASDRCSIPCNWFDLGKLIFPHWDHFPLWCRQQNYQRNLKKKCHLLSLDAWLCRGELVTSLMLWVSKLVNWSLSTFLSLVAFWQTKLRNQKKLCITRTVACELNKKNATKDCVPCELK